MSTIHAPTTPPMRTPAPHAHDWLKRLAGRFLAFEGADGSGKSTQLQRFVAACRAAGLAVCEVREPGGTYVGERIRAVLLEHADEDICLRTEMLLYMASRAQLVESKVRPALEAGQLVVADRFVASTLAYQGAAGGLAEAEIRAVAQVATGGLMPDLNVVFDVDEATAAGRLSPLLDRMESRSREFHAKVRAGYLEQSRREPDRYAVVDARSGADEVFAAMMGELERRSRAW
ncbi:MAG: dTMP kinase [Phycisphaeraceae bacterium]|nr:dTMP kinase [Phycisphaeraceae bacterium]